MSVWVEIRCEMQEPGCVSWNNNGPMGMVPHERSGLIRGVAALETRAKREGWHRVPGGYLCPSCYAKQKST